MKTDFSPESCCAGHREAAVVLVPPCLQVCLSSLFGHQFNFHLRTGSVECRVQRHKGAPTRCIKELVDTHCVCRAGRAPFGGGAREGGDAPRQWSAYYPRGVQTVVIVHLGPRFPPSDAQYKKMLACKRGFLLRLNTRLLESYSGYTNDGVSLKAAKTGSTW